MKARPPSVAAYPLLLALGALDATGYSVIVPVAPAIADATGAGPATIGVLVASFPVGMVAGFAIAGWAVRRYGAQALLMASLAVMGTGSLGFVLGESLAVYFPARALMGLGSGGLWIGLTFDTMARWPGQEYACVSRIFAAYSVGGLVGPALGILPGVSGPFLAYLLLLLAAVPLVWAIAPHEMPRVFDSDRAVLRAPGFVLASGAILFASLALGVLEGVLPLHFAEKLGQAQIGALYVGASLLVAVSAVRAAGVRPRPLMMASVLLAVAGISLAGVATELPLWVLALVLAAVGIGIGNTGSLGLLVNAVPIERIVTAVVVWSQIGIVGYLVGPLAGGLVAEGPGYAFIGLVPALAGLALFVLARRERFAGQAPT